MNPIRIGWLILLTFWSVPLLAQYTIRDPKAIRLDGRWRFALDPMEVGQTGKWYLDKAPLDRWDNVTVPHCFSTDPRFQFFTGTVWYRRNFQWKPQSGRRVLLHFDAAYYKTTVWLNNRPVGTHEGGYTPFSFEVTDFLQAGDNTLAVSVNNNTWLPGTIPGAKDLNEPNAPFMGWLNYGGLIRPVYLTIEPETYIENLKVEATPDLANGTAILRVKTRMRAPGSTRIGTPKLSAIVRQNGKPISLTWKTSTNPNGQEWVSQTSMKAADVTLWSPDKPQLYTLQVVAGADTAETHFGIRKVEVRNAQLLLNGKPIKMAGGNRVVDYPGLGSVEPDWLVEKDLRMMKEAGMELQRLTHYTPTEAVYDWADRHGMLIIAEAGNWQLTPNQMDNDTIRANFQRQFREMAERDWNHPSIIAYSVGNEYLSEQPAGQRWTKDMIAYARQLDPTRLYTFASMRLNILPKKPEDEASQYCDFVSTNTYGNHLNVLKHIHALYPDKPIFVSEYGIRADAKNGEAGQVEHLEKFLADIRPLPYVIGASWWTFNDYLSRYSGTNPDGTRPWGLVRHDRSKRPLYQAHQQSMAPLTVEKVSFALGNQGIHQLNLRLTARADFPAYTLENYTLKANGQSFPLPTLQPGQSTTLSVPIRGFDQQTSIEIVKPTGFTILTQLLPLY